MWGRHGAPRVRRARGRHAAPRIEAVPGACGVTGWPCQARPCGRGGAQARAGSSWCSRLPRSWRWFQVCVRARARAAAAGGVYAAAGYGAAWRRGARCAGCHGASSWAGARGCCPPRAHFAPRGGGRARDDRPCGLCTMALRGARVCAGAAAPGLPRCAARPGRRRPLRRAGANE